MAWVKISPIGDFLGLGTVGQGTPGSEVHPDAKPPQHCRLGSIDLLVIAFKLHTGNHSQPGKQPNKRHSFGPAETPLDHAIQRTDIAQILALMLA